MKALLNLISLAALAAIGAGIWMLGPPGTEMPAAAPQPDPAPVADTIPDNPLPAEAAPQDAAPETVPEAAGNGFAVEGVQPGYFIPSADLVFNGFRLEHVQAMQAGNGFEETVSIVFADTGRVAGTNERGEYYETVWMDADTYSIGPGAVTVEGTHPDLGAVAIAGVWDEPGYAAWTSGADSVDRLFTADVTIGGATLEDVAFSFWIGD